MGTGTGARNIGCFRERTRIALRLFAMAMGLTGGVAVVPTWAVTAESPEVKKLVEAGLAALESPADPAVDRYGARLGGKCVVGLAFVKAGQPDHPRVKDALAACRAGLNDDSQVDVYSNGLALVFLCELGAKRHLREIEAYLKLMHDRQKEHGGWGYDGRSPEGNNWTTGDTSQTQYAALGYWSAFRNGLRIDPVSLEALADWLVRTQDPAGGWAYQGNIPPTSQPIPQGDLNCSMLAAGMGSTLICVDLIDARLPLKLRTGDFSQVPEDLLGELPPAVRVITSAGQQGKPAPVRISGDRVSAGELFEAIDRGRQWMDKHYQVDVGRYTYYYLYATERYQSFYELIEGEAEEEPKWYTDGYQYLLSTQRDEGGWEGGCGKSVDTAFAVLFLLRSTQKSIQGTLGEGQLVGGRGLPSNLARAKLRGSQVVVEQVQTRVEEMLAMIDDEEQGELDDLARDPTALVVDVVDETSARRLRQLARGGEPEVRLLAVRALARTGNLDYVPTLIYALTDPDPQIVLEARDGLQFVSRRFDGFGPPNNFTEDQRFEAVDAWKRWYRTLRPDAMLD
jgi:hypothetical protein